MKHFEFQNAINICVGIDFSKFGRCCCLDTTISIDNNNYVIFGAWAIGATVNFWRFSVGNFSKMRQNLATKCEPENSIYRTATKGKSQKTRSIIELIDKFDKSVYV